MGRKRKYYERSDDDGDGDDADDDDDDDYDERYICIYNNDIGFGRHISFQGLKRRGLKRNELGDADKRTDRKIDGQTVGQTDKPDYLDLRTHLKSD